MRFAFIGDLVGRSGRQLVLDRINELRDRLRLDFLVVNAENAAGGFGLTGSIADSLFEAGVDAITLGNHAFDQRDMLGHIEREARIIRPLNMASNTPGRGSVELRNAKGQKLLVVQLMGRLFMGMYDDPFKAIDQQLKPYFLGGNVDAILVDIHAEATSEKMALGHFLDGRSSLVAGTHTHIPTADHRVLAGGTAYITDVGMSGDYDSVIGMNKNISLERWQKHTPGPRHEPAGGDACLCGVVVETDAKTGLATSIDPIRWGHGLVNTVN